MYKIILVLSILLFTACHTDLPQAEKLFEKGKTLESEGYIDSAVMVYHHAIDLLDHTNENKLKGEIHNQLGNLFTNNSLYQNAFDAFQEGLKYNIQLEDLTNASKSLRGMGKSYAFRLVPDSAIKYVLKAYQLIPRIKDNEEISSIHNNLSGMYVDLKDYDKALQHNALSSSITQDSANIYRNYYIKGEIFNIQEKYDSAWVYYTAAAQSDNIYTKAGCYLELSRLAKKTQHPKYAEYMEAYHDLNDSIARLEQTSAITIAEQNHLKNAISKEKTKLSNWIFAILGMSLLLIGYHQYKIRRAIKKNNAMDKILQDNEIIINRLQRQMSDINNELIQSKAQQETEQKQTEIYERLKKMQETVISNIKLTGEECTKNFLKSKTYKEMKSKLKEQKFVLPQSEQDKYQAAVIKEFSPYIQYLSTFAKMSHEDYYLCCLALSGFSTKECAFCRGVTNEAIRSQKIRIKEKFMKSFGTLIPFKHIF